MCKLHYYTDKLYEDLDINVNKRRDRVYFYIHYNNHLILRIVVWIDEEKRA